MAEGKIELSQKTLSPLQNMDVAQLYFWVALLCVSHCVLNLCRAQ